MATGQIPNWFVVIMGLGTVFVGLICIVGILLIMGYVVQHMAENRGEVKAVSQAANSVAETLSPEEHRELVAAISAVIAEELGTDISAIRICSMKRVS